MRTSVVCAVCAVCLLLTCTMAAAQERTEIPLPSSKLLLAPAPGGPQRTNSLPLTMASSPDGKYLALLNNGYGTAEANGEQSIAIFDVANNRLADYPEARLGHDAPQTFFCGLAFSGDGRHLYASLASITDPLGEKPGDSGNGIAVYGLEDGRPVPERVIRIPLQTLAPGKRRARISGALPAGKAIPYPAGLAVIPPQQAKSGAGEKLVVADNLSDDAVLIDVTTGRILHRFDLSVSPHVPAAYPYAVVADRAGRRAWVSLWNGSRVAELDLATGKVARFISLAAPKLATEAGSHPSALLLSADERTLYVALSNADKVAVIDVRQGQATRFLSTLLPGQSHGGTYPNALALGPGDATLYVANASSDAVAVIDLKAGNQSKGFIPTEWYPTAVLVHEGELFIASGKGQSTGPNSGPATAADPRRAHPYIASLLHGSLARVKLEGLDAQLPGLTEEVLHSNLMDGRAERIAFQKEGNPIRHVIYVIKENRTYDQIFGDLRPGNGDPTLVMYGEDITPNQHKLARQFGILDNFYDSGEVSGDGHVWSTAAVTSDYTEKTWQISYRGNERTYDYEGDVANGIPLEQGIPDVDEPGTGYLWANLARQRRTYRQYGEFVSSLWCNQRWPGPQSPKRGTPIIPGAACPHTSVAPGEKLPDGQANPYHWPVPILAQNRATKPQLRGHFDPRYADFNMRYPDQLRIDEFLREFSGFVRDGNLPGFVLVRLPNDHTAGTRPQYPTPSAAVADNDLAVGRLVEAVSHSRYWDSTAIFILEDDAQNGADHVDAHRSIALVVSKYSPSRPQEPFVEHRFYTTVNVVHTMEALLGLPPMNNNDARAALMAPLFAGDGLQPPFTADTTNRDNGLVYQANQPNAPGADESAKLDFSHADAADSTTLNAILWRDRKGNAPLPPVVHGMIRNGN